jgi:pimeloyl-ACP methyl ester carboxylesterase
MLTRGDFAMEKEAEKRGYICVSPLGYITGGGWGSTFRIVSAPRQGGAPGGPAGPGAPGARGGPGAPGGRGATPNPAQTRTRELSEKDALNVLDLVMKEYNADSSRVYLMGNSMGGVGTWYLGQKFPEKWTAIAPAAGPVEVETYPYEHLQGLPVLGVHVRSFEFFEP